jgi:predicted methyltransferase
MNRTFSVGPSLAGRLFAPTGVALLLACAQGDPPPRAPVAASALVATDVGSALLAALAGAQRTTRERTRDSARHPLETLTFFGLRRDATVVELWPGGGYYTAILAPLLLEPGKLVVTHFDPAGDPKSEDTQDAHAILDRLAKSPGVFGKVEPRQIAVTALSFGPDGSADFVLTFRNIHNWIDEGYASDVFAAAARVLKPGGVFGVEEHRGKPGMTVAQIRATGYVPEEVVVDLARRAGMQLVARSEVNANPRDTKDYEKGVWSLPPTLAEKDANREKYLAIGESDRMTLKFVKP